MQHSKRADRRKNQENLADLIDPDVATNQLLNAGFVLKPSKCARCGLKSVQGPFARPDASPLSRYWRCDQHACKHWMNVLQGAKWLEGVTRFRSLTPARLWHVISRYVTLTRQAVASGLGAEGPKIAQFVMDSLRTLEAGEGRRMNATLSLTGQCEVDGTSLRPLYINNRSLHWSEEISDWVRSSKHFIPCFYHLMFAFSSLLEYISLRIPLPCSDGKSEKNLQWYFRKCSVYFLAALYSGRKKKQLPIYFLTHLRWAGCVERGEGGRLLLCQLDHILLQPGSCPATESLKDVRKTGFLKQLQRPCTVYGDGAKSWKSECKRVRLCFRDVTHYKMEFTRKIKVKHKVRISGTQLLDQVWRHLKRYVPFSVHSKDKVTRKDSKRIQQYV